jgi:hypothetical protein
MLLQTHFTVSKNLQDMPEHTERLKENSISALKDLIFDLIKGGGRFEFGELVESSNYNEFIKETQYNFYIPYIDLDVRLNPVEYKEN